jgi:hypothetical protein
MVLLETSLTTQCISLVNLAANVHLDLFARMSLKVFAVSIFPTLEFSLYINRLYTSIYLLRQLGPIASVLSLKNTNIISLRTITFQKIFEESVAFRGNSGNFRKTWGQ